MEDEKFDFETVDPNGKLTEDVVFEQLADSFIVLENLINGASNSKNNLEKIYELLDGIRVITTDLKESVVSIKNINTISKNMSKLDSTLKEWVEEEVKMISALNSVVTEQKSIKDLIVKTGKKRMVEDNIHSESNSSSNSSVSITNILIVIAIGINVATFVLR